MTKKVSTLALMAVLSSSLVFAGDKKKTNSSTHDSPATLEQSTQNSANPDNRQVKPKKNQRQAKPATRQEEEFNRVLQGIYG